MQQNINSQYQQQIAAQLIQQHQQQQFVQQQSQNQLMGQQGNIQQVLLQQQQLPTVTVTSGVSLQQAMPHVNQQSLMTKAGQVIQLQPASSQSVATSMANTQIVTSMAGSISADTSNAILGPLTSPQTPLQPPQNPLIAMTTLSASPMSAVGVQKEKTDSANGDSQKISMSVTMSPLKRQAEDSKQTEAKKQMTEDNKKSDETTNGNSSNPTPMSPSVNKSQSAPGTPTSSTKTSTVNSPLAAQNGESDPKKSTSNASTNVPMLKNELPKAMVKPNVLTHVIEGYVIQESNEPFPVTRQRYSEKENDEPPKKKQAVEETKSDTSRTNGESGTTSNVVPSSAPQLSTDLVPCEHCGKQEMRGKLKKKRFCSLICAKATKNASIDSPNVSIGNGDDKISTPNTPSEKSKLEAESDLPAVEEHVMLKWSVAQVCDFIKNLPGCTDYAEDFKLQEIDGQALLLLKENHLVSAMGMKLGPALKIVNKIESMRVSKEGESTETPPDQQ